MATTPDKGTLVEGLGNEVITAALLSIITITSTYVLFCVTNRRLDGGRAGVHPDQAETVENTRRDLGVDQPPDHGGDEDHNTDSCPVCLAPLNYPVQTNCGHNFCSQCLLSYWRHDQWPSPARCPVCRRQITLLLPSRSLQFSNGDGQLLWAEVTDYNQRMSGQWRPLMHYLYDVPILLRHLVRDLFTVRGLVLLYRLHILFILFVCAIYLLSPFDLFPEAVFGVLGLLDDVIIVLGVIVYISIVYRGYVANGMH